MSAQSAAILALIAVACACFSAVFYLAWRRRTSGLERRIQQLETGKDNSLEKPSRLSAHVLPAFIGACVLGVVALLLGMPFWLAALLSIVGLLAGPYWAKRRRHAKELKAFADEFPNALDVIIRGVKAGLPLVEGIKTVAKDGREPVRSHFERIGQDQAIGIPLNEAVERFAERLNTAEARFFAIVVGIQSKSGGSFSEALTNLTSVIRERHKMRRKIKSLSAEAKASAIIIGALPVVVALLIHVTSPDYIALLFHDGRGIAVLIACGIWMAMGVVVMRKMINFDF
jgi:tight adherence protein B